MALSSDTADQIVAVVSSDPICCARIEAPTLGGILSALHIAGSVRNIALILGGLERTDELFVRVCCMGISEATSTAIWEGVQAEAIQGVQTSTQIYRVVNGTSHHGTRVVMLDGSEYVFDWFPTLDPENPVIYRIASWRRNGPGMDYDEFAGFDEW